MECNGARFQRDILDLARHDGLGLAPWNVLGGGKFQTKAQIEERKQRGEGLRSTFGSAQSANEAKMSAALDLVREEVGAPSITSVALAYVLQKQPYVFPVGPAVSWSYRQSAYWLDVLIACRGSKSDAFDGQYRCSLNTSDQ